MPEILSDVCSVSLSLGENMISQFCFKAVPINITRWELAIDFLVLKMVDYDVILGMDKLSKYNTTIVCKKKKGGLLISWRRYILVQGHIKREEIDGNFSNEGIEDVSKRMCWLFDKCNGHNQENETRTN